MFSDNTSSSSSSSSLSGENDNNGYVDEISQAFEQEPSSSKLEKVLSLVKVSKRRRNRKSYKRPSNNPIYMPALRILRRDIRRKYCEMMNNVINSYDPSLILNFFRDFSIPNIQRVLHYPNDTLQLLQQAPMISGIEDQVKDFSMSYKLIPDVVFTLTDVKVCKSSNNSGSRIVAKTSVRGTLLYSTRKRMMISENVDLIECDSTSTSEVVEGIDDLMLEPLETPLPYELNGILTIHLDEEHRMVLLEIQPLDC